jgi:hypothetical protein
MKSVGLFILSGCLFATLGTGCMTDSAAPESSATQQVQQSALGGGDQCSEWASCYAGCSMCWDDASCEEQALDRSSCDTLYDPAPEICPYPG